MSTSASDLSDSNTSSTNTNSGKSSMGSSTNSSAPSSAESSAPPSPKFSSTSDRTSSIPSSTVFASGSSSSSNLISSDSSISASSSSSSPSLPPQSGNKTHPGVPMNRKTSLIHRFKKTLWQGDRTINSEDPKFDVAINQFKSLNDTFYRLRLHLSQYVGNLRGLITTSNAIALDFALGIDEQQVKQTTIDQDQHQSDSSPAQSHDYSSILSAVRSSHQSFHIERSEQLCVLLEREAIGPVDKALSQMIPINRDIEKRQQLRSEHDYYFKKLSTLQQERVMKHDGSSQDRQMDKKKEARLERNQAKYEEVNQEYHHFSSNLIQSLRSFYDHRVSVLGPSLQIFLKVEKEISEMLHQNKMSEQNLKDMEEKNAKKQEELKEEEKKVSQIIRKQTFAEHYFSSQEFSDELQQAIEKKNRKNPIESFQAIEQKLQKSTQNLVQEAAKDKPDLTSHVLTKREVPIESKDTNYESALSKDQEKEVSSEPRANVTEEVLNLPQDMKKTMKEESVDQNQIKEVSDTQIRITPNLSASNLPMTSSSDSFSKDSLEPKSDSKALTSSEKEKTEFSGESRSLTDRPKGSIPSSETMPERSPSVNEPTFHIESDDQIFSKGGNESDRDRGNEKEVVKKSISSTKQTV